ncbi:Nicotinamide/nicotinic acid mononucleotide adenylyltransferase 1 [Saitoella coloradoensis]
MNRISDGMDLEEVPMGITRQAIDLASYKFPDHRLRRVMADETKAPLVIVACGSFSPVTYLHLRIFEMALDNIRERTDFEVMGGYYSPVSDHYKKAGLAPASHRVRMCELASERTSSWLMVDAWESLQDSYTRTAVVLDHFHHEINEVRDGVRTKSGEHRKVKVMLLAGGDLIETMAEPNVWADADLHHILGKHGALVVERTGADVWKFLLSHDILYEHRKNIIVIKQLIYNDISSTKVRLFLRRGMSVQYLLPNSVIKYIEENGLYQDTEPVKLVIADKGA